jgi:hypothetical protein
VRFLVRAHGNYNDLIMRVLNLGIGANQKVSDGNEEEKVFDRFERYIRGVLDNVSKKNEKESQ